MIYNTYLTIKQKAVSYKEALEKINSVLTKNPDLIAYGFELKIVEDGKVLPIKNDSLKMVSTSSSTIEKTPNG